MFSPDLLIKKLVSVPALDRKMPKSEPMHVEANAGTCSPVLCGTML
jgi:hypothetical protein